MPQVALFYRAMKLAPLIAALALAISAQAQIQVDLKLPRLQHIAYEPVLATIHITNLAGRDIDLHDGGGQTWFGFEVIGQEGQPIGLLKADNAAPPLKIEAGKRVTQKINLTPLYPVHDVGTYRVRAHIYFADLNKFYYSQTKVFQVADARPIWQRTVGIPEGNRAPGSTRTYSLLTNRFPDHTSLYVRVADTERGIVYATYSLGRIIALDEPQAELDRANQLHILHCAAPRTWAYSRVGLNGELVSHSSFMETRRRPRLFHALDGLVTVRGGVNEMPVAQAAGTELKLSERPTQMPKDE